MFIKDIETGKIKKYGADVHDALRISEDGKSLIYEHLQNGDGSMGGYRFTDDQGRVPEEREEVQKHGAPVYADIAGDMHETELYKHYTELLDNYLKQTERIKRAFERVEKDIAADYKTEDYYSALSKKDTLAIFEEELKG